MSSKLTFKDLPIGKSFSLYNGEYGYKISNGRANCYYQEPPLYIKTFNVNPNEILMWYESKTKDKKGAS
jgi:hypothetical protein